MRRSCIAFAVFALGCTSTSPPPGEPLTPPTIAPSETPPPPGDAPPTAAPAPGDAPPPEASPPPLRTGPKGVVLGTVVDAVSGEPLVGAAVVEMDIEPPNAVQSQELGHFNLSPKSWAPAQLWTQPEGTIGASLALDQSAYERIGAPALLAVSPVEAGIAALKESTGMEWPEGVGVVRVEFTVPRPQDAEGLSAMLTTPGAVPFVVDAEGNSISGHTLVNGSTVHTLTFVGVIPGPTALTVTPNPVMACTGASTLIVRPRMIHTVPVLCVGTN